MSAKGLGILRPMTPVSWDGQYFRLMAGWIGGDYVQIAYLVAVVQSSRICNLIRLSLLTGDLRRFFL